MTSFSSKPHANGYSWSCAKRELLIKINRLIESHLTDPDFGASQLADKLGVSRGHLNRQLLALIGCPPARYILMRRMERASVMLIHGRDPVKNVALKTGFRSYSAFWKAFTRTFNTNPESYLGTAVKKDEQEPLKWVMPPSDLFKSHLSQLFSTQPRMAAFFSVLIRKIEEEEVTVKSLSEPLHISPSQLLRDLKAHLDITPIKLLYQLRILKSAELLRDPDLALSEIAYRSGFFDQAHMNRAFKVAFGCSPSSFRKANRHNDFLTWLRKELM